MSRDDVQVLVVGGGLAGLALARGLYRNGLDPVVIERDETVERPASPVELWPDAMTMLDWLDVGDDVRDAGTPVRSWSRRGPDGVVETRAETTGSPGFVTVRYGDLRERLARSVPDAAVRTGTAFRSSRPAGESVRVEFANGVREGFDLVVGADGVRSATRVGTSGATATFCGTTSASFSLPSDANVDEATEVWTTDGVVFRALPTRDGVAGWITVPADDPAADDFGPATVRNAASEVDWLLAAALGSAAMDDAWSDADFRVGVDWWRDGRIAFVGDAAHGRHRLTGVGPTLALEDALVLVDALASADEPLRERLDEYTTRRQSRMEEAFPGTGRRSPLAGIDPARTPLRSNVLDVRSRRLHASFGSTPPTPAIDRP